MDGKVDIIFMEPIFLLLLLFDVVYFFLTFRTITLWD